MRRNSGKDESRDRLLDPTMKEHEGRARQERRCGPRSARERRLDRGQQGAADDRHGIERPQDCRGRRDRLTDPIEIRDAVERQRENDLAGARRPAERRLRVAHPFAGADDPP